MESMFVMLQFSIWIIVFIMIAMVVLYISLMSKKHNKTTYTTNDEEKEIEIMYRKIEEDNGLNSNDDDDGPIQHL